MKLIKEKSKNILLILCASMFLILGIVIIYFYCRVPFTVSNRKATNLNYKVIELQNQTLVYLPYELIVSNNRWQILKLKGVYDSAVLDDISLDENLIFTTDGVRIDFSTWIKKNSIIETLPFATTKFLYFKRHILSNQNFKPIVADDIASQINQLSSSSKIKLKTNVVDSLYQSDEGARFNIQFGGRSVSSTKFTKAVIGSEKQKQVIILDSLKGLNKEASQKYLLKFASTDIRQLLEDF